MIKYNKLKKFISVLMLSAFISPSSLAVSTYGSSADFSNYNSSLAASSMNLSTVTKLTADNSPITLSLRDSDVKQVLRMFADKVGKNVVFHNSVEGKVTLDLVNMPIDDAFNLVLQVAGLNYYVQNNTLIIIAKNSEDNAVFSKQEMMVFPVQYVSAAKIADFLNKNVFSMKKAGMSGIDAATVNAATNELIVFGMPSDAAIVNKVIMQLDREPITRTFVVNHTTPKEMADMICNMLLPARGTGGASSSGNSANVFTGGAAGIVTGGAASASSGGDLKLGEGVVACTISQTSGSEAATGFDIQNLAISYFPQRGTITTMGGSEAQIRMIEHFIKTNDIRQPQAYLEMSIVELNEAGSKEFSNNWSIQSRAWAFKFAGGMTSGGREAEPGGRWYEVIDRHFEPGAWVQNADGSKTWKDATYKETPYKTQNLFEKSTYISWTMNYLIENQKARVLANPKILITNGQESVIDLTQDYVEKVTSEFLSSSTSGTYTTGTVQRNYTIGSDKGIKVSLTPFISPEGYVTLNIKPEYSTEAGQVTTSNSEGGRDIQATLLSRRNLDLKNVRIKDGETLVIGGLIQESEQKTVQKIPVLGDLPVIGSAFRSTTTSKIKAELVIMITPTIIKDNDDTVADNL